MTPELPSLLLTAAIVNIPILIDFCLLHGSGPCTRISEEEMIEGQACLEGSLSFGGPCCQALSISLSPSGFPRLPPGVLPHTFTPSHSVPEAGLPPSRSSSEHLTGKQDLEAGGRNWLGSSRVGGSTKWGRIQSSRGESDHNLIV